MGVRPGPNKCESETWQESKRGYDRTPKVMTPPSAQHSYRVSPNFDWQAVQPEYTPEYVASMRRMTGAQKLEMAAALRRMARHIKTSAVKRRHPDWTEAQIQREVSRIILLSSSGA